MRKLPCVYIMSCLVLLLLFSGQQAGAADNKIFIVHSYSIDNICGAPQHQGVLEALAENGFVEGENLTVGSYAMDTKKVNNTPELIESEGRSTLEKIRDFKPEVVVVLDDNAFRTVGLELLDSDVDVVYSGMNGQPEDYDKKKKWLNSPAKPGHNITGVYEKLLVADALRVQRMIIPDLKKILFISDNSPTGRAIYKQFIKEVKDIDKSLKFEIKIAYSWEEYKHIIREADSNPEIGGLYLAATMLKDAQGKSYGTEDVIKWTIENSRTPGIPLNYSFSRLGMFGGAGVDFISMGRQAGNMVARILQGTSAGDIPLEDARRYALVFNLKRARELGIEIPNDMLMAADAVYK